MTAGLDKNRMKQRAIKKRKKRLKENYDMISPMFFQRMSIGSDALLTMIIVLLFS
jgi:hypothetical protein